MLMKRFIRDIYSLFFRRGFGTPLWKYKFRYFGKNSEIEYPAIISHKANISIGDNTTILRGARIQNYEGVICNPQIKIGNRCYLGYNLSLLNASNITIGDDVLFASNILISSENHGIDPENTIQYMDQPLNSKAINIGDGCWLGEKVCVLPGVTIGKKCIIGAGSIVTKSIPDFSIAVGNPAKVIKKYNFETHKWDKAL